jgi:hypothetical protein
VFPRGGFDGRAAQVNAMAVRVTTRKLMVVTALAAVNLCMFQRFRDADRFAFTQLENERQSWSGLVITNLAGLALLLRRPAGQSPFLIGFAASGFLVAVISAASWQIDPDRMNDIWDLIQGPIMTAVGRLIRNGLPPAFLRDIDDGALYMKLLIYVVAGPVVTFPTALAQTLFAFGGGLLFRKVLPVRINDGSRVARKDGA